ncbi:MAG: hypothetical protein HC819_24860, partial [Cyclobacteriaceae bacterium]|nr:hypothetical protein [Cyclobacteriaceae bacterium]
MLKIVLCYACLSVMCALPAMAQLPKRSLPQNINRPNYSHIFPSLSGDGNQMVFFSNYTNSEGFEARYSVKTGPESWTDPEPLSGISRQALDHIGSYCLSHDGNTLVFASRRSPGIGNYDIWVSEKIGEKWTEPKNPGKPLNSPTNEGNPCLSPDGKSIYFMRCETMDQINKNKCRLFVAHKKGNSWQEAEALPEDINTGHETTPRILADNKTLIFASGRPGGKGMLDLYISTFDDEKWQAPRSLDFLNSELNEEYVSVPARGDLLYFSAPYREDQRLFMTLVPEAYQQNKVLMLTGTIDYADGQDPVDDVLVQAYDVEKGTLFSNTKLRQHDRGYTMFLPEGSAYDVSFFPQTGGHVFASQLIDLSHMQISRKEDWTTTLEAVRPGVEIPLFAIRFERYGADLSGTSETAIKRIVGFLKKNPGIKAEIGAFIDKVYYDSLSSNELNEVLADTVFLTLKKSLPYKPEQPGSENQDIENGVAPDGQSGSSIELRTKMRFWPVVTS